MSSITPSQQAEDAQYHRAVLNELTEIGMGFCRLLHQQAEAEPQWNDISYPVAQLPRDKNPHINPDRALIFSDVARTIRRTILLAQKVAQGPQPLRAQPAPRDAAPSAPFKELVHDVRAALSRTRQDAEPLRADSLDRIDSPDLDDDLEARPLEDIISEICQDLGVEVPLPPPPQPELQPKPKAPPTSLSPRERAGVRAPRKQNRKR